MKLGKSIALTMSKKDGVDGGTVYEPLDDSLQEGTCEHLTSCRWIICYVACASRVAVSMLRQCVGMAIVCMNSRGSACVDEERVETGEQTSSDRTLNVPCSDLATNGSIPADWKDTEFHWSSGFEGLVLASFTFGFAASPILGGYVAGRFGGKLNVTVALVVGGVLSCLTPAATRLQPALLVVCRVAMGAFMGVVEPSHQSLWVVWAPLQEKTRMTSFAFSGVAIAGILSFAISGFLCSIRLDGGWPFIFYVIGGYTLLVAPLWHLLVFNSPAEHPRISYRESAFISLTNSRADVNQNGPSRMPPPPWLRIFTSPAFLAILAAHVTFSWVTSLMMAYLPMYMSEVLGFGIEQVGVLASLPFLGRFVLCLTVGHLSDWVIARKSLTTLQCRKLVQVVGCMTCAVCVTVVGFLGRDQSVLAVLLLVIGLSFQNSTSVAFRVNLLDIAPRYASVLIGITMTFAMVASLLAPLITSAIIKKGVREEWQKVFWIVAAMNLIGSVVFVIFARGEEQEWAKLKDSPDDVAEKVETSAGEAENDLSPVTNQDQEYLLLTPRRVKRR